MERATRTQDPKNYAKTAFPASIFDGSIQDSQQGRMGRNRSISNYSYVKDSTLGPDFRWFITYELLFRMIQHRASRDFVFYMN